MNINRHVFYVLLATGWASITFGQSLLVEAEGFDDHGGWKLDTQSIETMGSPYLLAHGLGKPVTDATKSISFPETGEYHVYVRTKDWVARWNAEGAPGKFQVVINGKPLSETFGTESADWFWHDGGTVKIEDTSVKLALHDLTGFEGRCDAILFSKEKIAPPNSGDELSKWRRKTLGIKEAAVENSDYDLVIVGGGYAGTGAAISAARMGCKVALIQNRPVLGGNGSSEVRVWAMGHIRRGKYPRIGEIIEEFCDHARKSPGTYEEFEDAKKESIVRAEKNIDLFLNHHAYKVETSDGSTAGSRHITAVHAFNTRTSEHVRFTGKLFADCTGHATVGYLAKADFEMTPKGRMGMSNMWAWDEADEAVSFPATPWALELNMEDFPYPRDHHGQWFWEGGFDKDAINDAEGIRDWNFRAVYGAFNAMKNRDGASDHANAFLTWMAFIGGPRESRRLMGDVVLTQEDVVAKREFKDGCVPSTWTIDLHYPKEQYAKKFPDNPFISIAVHDRRIDRSFGYPVPYRCFYSRNVENLFVAGRDVSVTHEALGTTRVMKTCGMMGEVVGRAARVCVKHACLPRDVYSDHWEEMATLLRLPGKAYASTVAEELVVPDDAMPLAGSKGPPRGKRPANIKGMVIDDTQATKTGKWTEGAGLKGFIGWGYIYAKADSDAKATFELKAPASARFDVRIAYQIHENRGTSVPITVVSSAGTTKRTVDMTVAPTLKEGFASVGEVSLSKDEKVTVTVGTQGAKGLSHADAVQLIRVDEAK